MKGTMFRRNPDLVWKKIDDEVVILDVEKSELYELKDTGMMVWELSKKYTTFTKVSKEIHLHYDVDLKTIEQDVARFIKKHPVLFLQRK